MTDTSTGTDSVTLPHWESTPDDLASATREVKRAIRRRIEASGRSVEEVFAAVEARIAQRVAEIRADQQRGQDVWPIIDYADIENGTVTPEQLDKLHRRGCLVVRGHFPREQALAWDAGIVDYVEGNAFFENYRGPGTTSSAASDPSRRSTRSTGRPSQMEARQSDAHGHGPGVPQRPVEARVRGDHVVRPRAGLPLPRPHPPSAAGRRLERPRYALRPGHARPLDDPGLPADLPSSVRRERRGVRPVGRRIPHRRSPVPRNDHVLGLPHLPGLDGVVGHGPRPRRAPHGPDPRGDGVPHAAAAARRRRRRRHVRCHHQPGLPRQREVAPAPDGGSQRHPRRAGGRLRLVALRHDPQCRASEGPEGLGQRHVHPRGPLVRAQRAVRREGEGRVRQRFQPERLPGRALRAHMARSVPAGAAQHHRTARPRTRLTSVGEEGGEAALRSAAEDGAVALDDDRSLREPPVSGQQGAHPALGSHVGSAHGRGPTASCPSRLDAASLRRHVHCGDSRPGAR